MKAQTRTILYVLGGLATLIGGGTAIYFATRDAKKTVTAAPPAPSIPVSDTKSATVDATPPLTQADIQQQQQNQQQPPPPKTPPSIQILQNLSQII